MNTSRTAPGGSGTWFPKASERNVVCRFIIKQQIMDIRSSMEVCLLAASRLISWVYLCACVQSSTSQQYRDAQASSGTSLRAVHYMHRAHQVCCIRKQSLRLRQCRCRALGS